MSKKIHIQKSSLENDFLKKEEYFQTILENEKDETILSNTRKEMYEFYTKNHEILKEYYNNPQDKARIYDNYLELNDPKYIKKQIDSDESNFCNNCNTFKILCNIDALLICPICSTQSSKIIEPEKPSFKDPPHDNYFAYKRENHFRDHLNRVQAKETTKIPQEVFDAVLYEFSKERYTNLADLDEKKVKSYLKKYIRYGFNKYYENIQQIINVLTGLKPLNIPIEREEKLISLFLKIEKAFIKHCPESKYNLTSYPILIYKECQILGYDEYLPYFVHFTESKSGAKKKEQNEIWKKICEECDLPYYPD